MSTKFVRFVVALVVIVSIFGNTGVARADHGALANVDSRKFEPPRAPGSQLLDTLSSIIPPASSLGVQFVHVATAANIAASGVGHATVIDHPLTNGNPNAIILVTPNYNPGGIGGTYDNHPIGVWYSDGTWRIFNQDLAAIPVGAAFNVIIPTAGAGVFVHTATFVYGNHTFISNALTDGNPNAIVFVTPNYNPGDICGCVYANFPIGVYYDSIASKWAILNQNVGAMPANASFNVFVLTAGAGVFVHTATAGNSAGDYTTIDNALTNGNPNAIVFVTPNWNPGGVGATYENHNIGVFYSSGKWRIFNQDITAVPVNAAFNVLVLVPVSDVFVQRATAANIVGHWTVIDNALTNSHPNAIVFTTPNWNPGGVGGTYNNHNIGVYYDTGQWTIFNQDFVAMPVNAAFNVLVPNPDTSVFVHKATVANITGHITTIDYPLTNGNADAILLVTPNWNPGATSGVYDNHPIGVWYSGGTWRIFNQDLVGMPVNAAFNVFVPTARPGVAVFVHTATLANINGGSVTIIDNALTNGNPNAIIIVTPNWNPGGLGGTYDNHPINVFYSSGKWAIFHPDLAAIQVGAAFNVYVDANRKLYLPLIMR